ncbi:hypothetical protein EDD11_009561 [Mortierella claussenii]|nr:hypothetical protein EDD11_009561 [Mortierella claussenii]
MNLSQVKYLNISRDGAFSLRAWALLGDTRDPEQLEVMWTQDAIKLLQKRNEQRGVNLLNRMSNMSKSERMAVFRKVKEDKDHGDKMRPTVNTHLHHLADGINDDLAQDARVKRQFQDVEETNAQEQKPVAPRRWRQVQGFTNAPVNHNANRYDNQCSYTVCRHFNLYWDGPYPYCWNPTLTFANEMYEMFNVSNVRPITTTIQGYKLCEPFKQLQIQAAAAFNNPIEKVSVANLPLFMAANYIWMSSTPLPGLTREAHNEICHSVRGNAQPLSERLLTLCSEFSSELAETGRVRARLLYTEEEEDLLLLYQNMGKRLPKEYFVWIQKNEDTFAHGAIDIILKHAFPENTPPYELGWANRPASGSKERRGDPLKPDATVLKSAREVAYVEIKAPKDSHSQSKFVEDMWSLASVARDQINLHLLNQHSITVIPCIQIFGYKVKLFKLEYDSGLYIWTEVASGYLPRDHQDLDGIPKLLSLITRLKDMLDNIDIERCLRTPPRRLPTELLPDDARPQPMNVTPSKRPFFTGHRRPSVIVQPEQDK